MVLDWLMEYQNVAFLACNDKRKLISDLSNMEIEVVAIDFDPKYKNVEQYICKDFVFDDVDYLEIPVLFNAEKTYPLGKLYNGDMVIIGDNKNHNGDCNPVFSVDQLVEQNGITTLYDSYTTPTHFGIYGTNRS